MLIYGYNLQLSRSLFTGFSLVWENDGGTNFDTLAQYKSILQFRGGAMFTTHLLTISLFQSNLLTDSALLDNAKQIFYLVFYLGYSLVLSVNLYGLSTDKDWASNILLSIGILLFVGMQAILIQIDKLTSRTGINTSDIVSLIVGIVTLGIAIYLLLKVKLRKVE